MECTIIENAEVILYGVRKKIKAQAIKTETGIKIAKNYNCMQYI